MVEVKRFPIASSADRRAFERQEEFLTRRLARAAPTNILEVGPGAGRITRHLALIGERLSVCDPSAENLARLEEELASERVAKIGFHRLSIGELAKLDDYSRFDAAIAVRVLPLVDDWEAALWALCDAVRPGGIVAFDLLCARSWPGWVGRVFRPKHSPGTMLERQEIDAALRALPLTKVETLRWGYPRWACFDGDPWCARLLPNFAFGRLVVGERTGEPLDAFDLLDPQCAPRRQ
jgi:SAM-dependent methyltransferase